MHLSAADLGGTKARAAAAATLAADQRAGSLLSRLRNAGALTREAPLALKSGTCDTQALASAIAAQALALLHSTLTGDLLTALMILIFCCRDGCARAPLALRPRLAPPGRSRPGPCGLRAAGRPAATCALSSPPLGPAPTPGGAAGRRLQEATWRGRPPPAAPGACALLGPFSPSLFTCFICHICCIRSFPIYSFI